MKKIGLLMVFATIVSLQSCVKENLDKQLFGTWNVTKVEGALFVNGTQFFTAVDNNPTGTVKFNNDGSGEQNYSYTLAATVYPQTGSFTWEANDDQIIIDRVNDPDMVWERISSSDSKQVAKYNFVVDATQNWDYTLTLEK